MNEKERLKLLRDIGSMAAAIGRIEGICQAAHMQERIDSALFEAVEVQCKRATEFLDAFVASLPEDVGWEEPIQDDEVPESDDDWGYEWDATADARR